MPVNRLMILLPYAVPVVAVLMIFVLGSSMSKRFRTKKITFLVTSPIL